MSLLKLGSAASSGLVFSNVCINISDPVKNGTYEPYDGHSYPLDSSLTLRGIPKLDANNNIYYDGDTYEADGTVTRRYGVYTFTGNESWVKLNDDSYYVNPGIGIKLPADANTVASWTMIPNLNVATRNQVAYAAAGDNAYGIDAVGQIYITTNVYTNRATMLTGNSMIFGLAAPTTETADPFTNPQILDPNGTEEYVDASAVAGTRDVSVPVGHETLYHEDLKGKIEGLPKDFSGIIAPTEAGFKATRAYTANDLIIINNVLYRVTASISNGGAITVGTNVTATTLAELLKSLIS